MGEESQHGLGECLRLSNNFNQDDASVIARLAWRIHFQAYSLPEVFTGCRPRSSPSRGEGYRGLGSRNHWGPFYKLPTTMAKVNNFKGVNLIFI